MKFSAAILYIFVVLISIASFANASRSTEPDYLLRSAGQYGIGYQDIAQINPQICPDKLYVKHINEGDFSPGNEQKNAPIANHQKFPILIFVPGSGVPVQAYTNIIDNLVSQGFIVLGLNSVFANGPIQLPSGHVVPRPASYQDAMRLENLADLNFILKELPSLKYSQALKNAIDFSRVGLLAHSMGAMNIVDMMKNDSQLPPIQTVVLMDPGNIKGVANYPLPRLDCPILILWSSYFKRQLHGSTNLGKDNDEVVLSSDHSVEYSNHLNFTDLSTLQYHPGYQIQSVHQWITDPKNMGVGRENGDILALNINKEISNFLNRYLKMDK